MLFKETVEPVTLELIIDLQTKSYLKGFHLVGGTALSLLMGHRKSVDVDLFSNTHFDEEEKLNYLNEDYSFQTSYTARNTIKGFIHNINVDIIAHNYPLLHDPVKQEGISMLSERDIIAMKLNAISSSGQRSKDFIDIYYLLDKYSVGDMVAYYRKKYNQQQDMHILKSLVYFDDVDLADWPFLIKEPGLKWETVKSVLRDKVTQYTRNKTD